MPSFKTKSREWNLTLDAPLIEEVRAKTCDVEGCRHRPNRDANCEAINLAALDGKAIDLLGDDPVLMVDVLWILCKEQAAAGNVSPDQFGRELVGQSFFDATDALSEAIADFFHGSKKALVKALWAKTTKMTEVGLTKALSKIDDPELEKQIEAAMDKRMEAKLAEALKTP